MRGHILVDLDNVLEGWPRGAAMSEFARRATSSLAPYKSTAKLETCVATIAFNTATAIDYGLTFENVRTLGRTLGRALAEHVGDVELALALTMPQTADVLLARLAREAPSDRGSGGYEFAALFSADGRLADSLALSVYQRDGMIPWIAVAQEKWLGRIWRMASGCTPVVRKWLSRPSVSRAVGRLEVPRHYTLCIDSDAFAAWASSRCLDLDPQLELSSLASLVDRHPWIASQVGTTKTSLRGVQRLMELPSTTVPHMGYVEANDGVEMRGEAQYPALAGGAGCASVGIGAVRFGTDGATVASRLSAAVLAATAAPFRIDPSGVNVSDALQNLPLGRSLGSQTVKVHVERRGRNLVARVDHPPTHQPQAWWLCKDSAVRSELRVIASGLLPRDVETMAAPMRGLAGGPARLALRSPLMPGDEISVPHAIASGTIGQAWTMPSVGKAQPVAVFSPKRSLSSSETISVVPIHEVQRSGSLLNFAAELWALPLVVPR